MAGAERSPPVVVVSGASGLVGRALAAGLRESGSRVRALTRGTPGPGEIAWDPAAGRIDATALEGATAVVHLAGEQIAERWTAEKKRRIRESRVQGTRTLVRALASLRAPPEVLVSASAVGYYGDRGDEPLHERSAPGDDFLAGVTRAWEEEARAAEASGIRVVRLRFGVVLDRGGGALRRLLLPFRLGVGGRIGDGRQWMSWIALSDAVGVIRFALTETALSGAVNAVAPQPVTNAEFTAVLGSVLRRPTALPVPALALRLAFGGMADATLLASQRALPSRLLEAGYEFRRPTLEGALREALATG